MPDPLDVLDARVVAALQIDGRAGWGLIAHALDEPEALVAHRGRNLLASGLVRVVGTPAPQAATVVLLRCSAGQDRVAALALARRGDTRFVHRLGGSTGVVGQVGCGPARLDRLVADELPRLPGLAEADALTVLRHVRTADEWQSGMLTDVERELLTTFLPPPAHAPFGELKQLPGTDQLLVRALALDARRGDDELAVATGLSHSAVPRRVERLRREGNLRVRVVVDPARLGHPVRAVLRIAAAPRHVGMVVEGLRREPGVVRACHVTGRWPLLAEVAVPGVDALHDLTTGAAWLGGVTELDTSMVVGTVKDGGLFAPPDEH